MRTIAIVQARMDSLRLPGKVMSLIENQTAIQRLLSRLALSKSLDQIVLATTQLSSDDKLADHVASLGVTVFRGDNQDVLRRFLDTASEHKADLVVRVTGDCPVIDPSIVDNVVRLAKSSEADYCSNVEPPTFPIGLDVEVFPLTSLLWADKNSRFIADREHVTAALRKSPSVTKRNLSSADDYSSERWTLDTREDLEVINNIFREFSGSNDFSWLEVIDLLGEKPELFSANRHLVRDHGLRLTIEEKIALANQLRPNESTD